MAISTRRPVSPWNLGHLDGAIQWKTFLWLDCDVGTLVGGSYLGAELAGTLPRRRRPHPVNSLGPEDVVCHEWLGGLLKQYERKSA